MKGLCVVTGASGFVGKALCFALLRRGHRVRAVSRRPVLDLEAAGAESWRTDLSESPQKLAPILDGAEAVFHVAAHVGMWGRYDEFYRHNVTATQNLLSTGARLEVPKFIYTSSPSVVADGTDLCGIDESYPYPSRHTAFYPRTKAIAEREVLAADGVRGMRTVALRPHLIFGPGDTNLIPTILRRAAAGRLVRIGDGTNLSDFTYIDDCVGAHLAAFDSLSRNPGCAGRPYFVSQGEPMGLWDFVERVLVLNGLPPIERSLPKSFAYAAAVLFEAGARFLPGEREPLLTRFLVCEMATSHFFSIDRARSELGFTPTVTVEEGLRRTFEASGKSAARCA